MRRQVAVVQAATQCITSWSSGHVFWHVPGRHVWRHDVRWRRKPSSRTRKAAAQRLQISTNTCHCNRQQEGQHPLTGQRAANFRLLANQWAESRLVTQWRHGCRAMRRSVCNAGASNGGRSLCVLISREWSNPLPIYWYHSKGNWLRQNFAAFIVEIVRKTTNLGIWGS